MDQPKVAIHEIEVQMQALSPSGLNKRPPFLEAEGEGAAGLEDGEDTHQPWSMPSRCASFRAVSSFRIGEARYWNGRSYFLAMAIAWSLTRWAFSSKNG